MSLEVLNKELALSSMRSALFLLLHCLFALNVAAQDLQFAWLSDTHVGSSTGEADLRAAVSDINANTNIDFVLLSGDVTEFGSLRHLQTAHEVLSGLRAPAFVIPGNHDTKWSESGATDFLRLWGADRFNFERGGYRFIGIHQGPLMRMGDGHWAPENMRWLREQLASMPDPEQPIVFITHYPLDNSIDNWFVALDILKTRNIQAVLCGHGHSNRKMTFEDVPGIMGRSNLRVKAATGGYNLVTISNKTLTCRERITGLETKPTWTSLTLGKLNSKDDAQPYPRPDYAVNDSYPNVKQAWRFETGFTIGSSPALYRNSALVADASGALRSLQLSTGRLNWEYKTKGPIYSTPSVSGDRAIVASTDGSIYALNCRNGNLAWSHETPRPIVASPVGSGRVAYIGSSENKLRAFDVSTGKLLWEFDGLGGFVEARPCIYQGKVIVGAWDQHLYCLDAASGALIWKWKGDKPGILYSPAAVWPVTAHDKVFLVAPDRQMTALNVNSGEVVWHSADTAVRESIGVSEDRKRVYVRAMNDLICAFDTRASSRQLVWETNVGFGYDINSAMLAEKNDTVFYGTKNGVVVALDSKSGTLKWKHRIGVTLVNTVVPVGKDRLLATDFDGQVVLLKF